jgi:hypothetical protein
MDRTKTSAYSISRALIRTVGPSKLADKKAKELLITILWSNCWQDQGDFPRSVNLVNNPFSANDFLLSTWSQIDLVHWFPSARRLELGELSMGFLSSARSEISMVKKVKDYESRFVDVEKFETVLLSLQDLRFDISRLKGDVADLMDDVRKLRVSSIRGL